MFTLAHPFVAITKEEVTSSCGGLLASSLAERAYLIHTLGFGSAFFNTGSNAHVACVWVLIWLQLQCLHVFTVLLWFLKHALLSFVVLCWPQGCTDIHTVLTDVCQRLTFMFSHISRRSVMVWCGAVSSRRIKKRHKGSFLYELSDRPVHPCWKPMMGMNCELHSCERCLKRATPQSWARIINKKTHVIREVPSFCNDEDSCCGDDLRPVTLFWLSGFRSLCNIDSRLVIRAPLLYLWSLYVTITLSIWKHTDELVLLIRTHQLTDVRLAAHRRFTLQHAAPPPYITMC